MVSVVMKTVLYWELSSDFLNIAIS